MPGTARRVEWGVRRGAMVVGEEGGATRMGEGAARVGEGGARMAEEKVSSPLSGLVAAVSYDNQVNTNIIQIRPWMSFLASQY